MPAIITHYLMSKASAASLGDGEVSKSIDECKDIFYLGAQGPDIMFFALGNRELNKLGSRMHREGINSFFAECVNKIRKTAAHEGRSEIIAYMVGFLCHYALDTCAHPYIYYKSGFADEDGNLGGESRERHRFLETSIDCLLSEALDEKDAYSLNIAKVISTTTKKRDLIGQFLSDVIAESYGQFIYPEDYAKALKDIALVYRLFRDKTGKRKMIAKVLGKVARDHGSTAALVHYSPVKDMDYLNTQRSAWSYPWDDSIQVNLTFMDLFNKAVEDSHIYINAFTKAINKEFDERIALKILGNKNFSTGLENPVKFLYYSIGFENSGGQVM